MSKKFFTYFLLACVVAWLLFSYVPDLRPLLPAVQLPGAWRNVMAGFGALGAAIFLVIQIWLVGSTFVALRKRRNQTTAHGPGPHLRVHLAVEVAWTALPILMTVGLIFAGYAIWAAQ